MFLIEVGLVIISIILLLIFVFREECYQHDARLKIECDKDCEEDCWEKWAYLVCECGHWYCEHEPGGFVDVVYTRDLGKLTPPYPQTYVEAGCQIKGCKCKEFKEKANG